MCLLRTQEIILNKGYTDINILGYYYFHAMADQNKWLV